MAKRSEQLREHLTYFGELGVDGISRDPAWRRRAEASGDRAQPGGGEPAAAEGDSLVAGWAKRTTRPSQGARSACPMFDHIDLPGGANAEERLRVVREELGECTRCKLHSTRTHLVFGVGSPDAELMFVGEAPGRDEDMQGIPFVGRAGQLLTKIIESIDLRRDDVYIANVIKCRPPDNRNPAPDEVRTCEPFLFAQVDAIQPRVIVALGSFAARALLRTEDANLEAAGTYLRLPRSSADSDLPPRLPAAEPRTQTRGLGGHEEGAVDSCGPRRGDAPPGVRSRSGPLPTHAHLPGARCNGHSGAWRARQGSAGHTCRDRVRHGGPRRPRRRHRDRHHERPCSRRSIPNR